ncbi:MAG: NTP transferase domain-containing protein [Leptospiraceae bacterium]|nr:NTP transferase domain-containing protein [Leptospiraceae bacterium]
MKCFIPAAGFGKRMEEFTQNLPKPLLPVAGIPLIYYALYYAYRLGIQEVAINLHYKSEMILEELKNFHWMTLRFSIEQSDILGTAGGIKTAIEGVWREDEKFLVINPDSIFSWSKDLESIMKSDFEEALLFLLPNPKGEEYTELNLVNGKIFFGGGEYYYPGISVLQCPQVGSQKTRMV